MSSTELISTSAAAWVYSQSTGALTHLGELVGYGYSGFNQGKNNPALESERDIGPIPRGYYSIGVAHDDPEKGPIVMALTPHAQPLYGREGFLIHGDSIAHPGCASHGCIILGHNVRERVALSPHRSLEVIG